MPTNCVSLCVSAVRDSNWLTFRSRVFSSLNILCIRSVYYPLLGCYLRVSVVLNGNDWIFDPALLNILCTRTAIYYKPLPACVCAGVSCTWRERLGFSLRALSSLNILCCTITANYPLLACVCAVSCTWRSCRWPSSSYRLSSSASATWSSFRSSVARRRCWSRSLSFTGRPPTALSVCRARPRKPGDTRCVTVSHHYVCLNSVEKKHIMCKAQTAAILYHFVQSSQW